MAPQSSFPGSHQLANSPYCQQTNANHFLKSCFSNTFAPVVGSHLLTTGHQIPDANLAKISVTILLSIRRQHRWLYARMCKLPSGQKTNPVFKISETLVVSNQCQQQDVLTVKTVPFTKCTVVRFRVVTDYERGRTLLKQTHQVKCQ
jgi:hypothetical protein